MLDPLIRPLIDPPLDRLARHLVSLGATANSVTVIGAALGLAALPALAFGLFNLALVCFLASRLLDGLDGAVARHRGGTDLGGYLDIVADFVVYAAVPFGFALHSPANALPAAFLLFGFMGTASSFLAFAIFAAKRQITTERRGRKAFFYLGGLTEGTETIAVLALCMIAPHWFPVLATGFAALCCLTAATRIGEAVRQLR